MCDKQCPDTDPKADEYPHAGPATVYLIVGLPGAGKTTRAKQLEVRERALRLTPDEWQISIFDGENPLDKRDIVEGELVNVGMRAAQLGVNVVFDFGLWAKDERSALRWIAGTVGARGRVVYLPITPEEQRQRVTDRYANAPGQTFPMSDAELIRWRAQFQPPDDEELLGRQIAAPPPGHATWSEWASRRWPSLPDKYGAPIR